MEPRTVLGPAYADAVAYASQVHAGQARKGSDIPYIAHLLGVSSLVLEAGGDEELAIAALLHDSAEDHGGEERLRDIESRFGPRVARIVRDCSDSLAPEAEQKVDWETRKREHLAHIPSVSDDVATVWFADKVHNGRAIVTDLHARGLGTMQRFNAPPDRVLWYYEENLVLAEQRGAPAALLVPLRKVIAELRVLLA